MPEMTSVRSWFEASQALDRNKSRVPQRVREVVLKVEHDPQVGHPTFQLRPLSLLNTQTRYSFTPYAWQQYCQKILRFPHKALDLRLLTPELIQRIAAERLERVPDRAVHMLVKTVQERPFIRGFVKPGEEPLSSSAILEAFLEGEAEHGIEVLGAPSFPDHQVHIPLLLGDEAAGENTVYEWPLRRGYYVVQSEVGAIKGDIRVDLFFFDQEREEIFIVRPDTPVPVLRGIDSDVGLANSIAALLEEFSEWQEDLNNIQADASETAPRTIPEESLAGLPFDPGTRRRVTALLAHRSSLGELGSRKLVASVIAELAKEEERPHRRFAMQVVAGDVLVGRHLR